MTYRFIHHSSLCVMIGWGYALVSLEEQWRSSGDLVGDWLHFISSGPCLAHKACRKESGGPMLGPRRGLQDTSERVGGGDAWVPHDPVTAEQIARSRGGFRGLNNIENTEFDSETTYHFRSFTGTVQHQRSPPDPGFPKTPTGGTFPETVPRILEVVNRFGWRHPS